MKLKLKQLLGIASFLALFAVVLSGCSNNKKESSGIKIVTTTNVYSDIAKNIVAAGFADEVEIQLAYAIGVARPVSISVSTFGTGKVSEDKLVAAIRKVFDLRPAGIIKMLDLRRPIYKQTAAYGAFGRDDLDLPWEKTDKVDELKKVIANEK